MRLSSIRGRLLALLISGLAAVIVPLGVAAYFHAQDGVAALLDYQLRQTALSLRRQSLLAVAMARERAGDDEGDMVVQIRDLASGLVYVSRQDWQLPFVAAEGFQELTWQQRRWRLFVLDTGDRTVQVAQPFTVRARMSADVALSNMAPLLALVPLAATIVWFGVGFGLRPLRRVTAALRQRRPDRLEPLPDAGLPDEIRPLAEALNGLLGRLDEAFLVQRQFVADAAHELRTPLTALQLQLGNLESATEQQRESALAAARHGLQRSARLVEQLLALARLDPESTAVVRPVELRNLAGEVIAALAPLAEARDIDLGLLEGAPLTVPGDSDALRLLLRNLVDNAIRYTPAGGRVDVEVGAVAGEALLAVTDSGRGIPEGERERVFDRFYRGQGTDLPGSGLGLAIVRRVAERHRGRVRLMPAPGNRGLRAECFLPRG